MTFELVVFLTPIPHPTGVGREVLSRLCNGGFLSPQERKEARPPPLHAHPQVTGFWKSPREVSSVGLGCAKALRTSPFEFLSLSFFPPVLLFVLFSFCVSFSLYLSVYLCCYFYVVSFLSFFLFDSRLPSFLPSFLPSVLPLCLSFLISVFLSFLLSFFLLPLPFVLLSFGSSFPSASFFLSLIRSFFLSAGPSILSF